LFNQTVCSELVPVRLSSKSELLEIVRAGLNGPDTTQCQRVERLCDDDDDDDMPASTVTIELETLTVTLSRGGTGS